MMLAATGRARETCSQADRLHMRRDGGTGDRADVPLAGASATTGARVIVAPDAPRSERPTDAIVIGVPEAAAAIDGD
jgi:hypothetical protein